MKIGFYGFNAGLLHRPEAMVRVLRTAEDAGLESVWSAEHVVLVDPQRAPSPAPPTAPFLGTIAALAFATASTTRLKVGSGVVLIPQREPIVLAKELAGVDVLSNGRLLVGVGVGYVPGEYDALGIPFEERGARASEHIEVLRALWTEDAPTFDGRFSRFAGIQSRPRPVQEPHPPIHVGGSSPAALRRAVRQGDGWYGFFEDLDSTRERLRQLAEVAEQVERPAHLGRLEITVTPPGPVDADTVQRFRDLGVDRLVLMRDVQDMLSGPGAGTEDEIVRFVAAAGDLEA